MWYQFYSLFFLKSLLYWSNNETTESQGVYEHRRKVKNEQTGIDLLYSGALLFVSLMQKSTIFLKI